MAGYLVAAVGTTLQYFTDQGVVLAGGTVSTFIAGTSTPVATFTDSTLGVSNGTVITLTSAGRLPASCWVGTGTRIKMVLKDSGGNTIANGTIDNLSGIGDPFGQPTFYAQTAIEIAVGVTPTNYTFPPYDIRRYGGDPTGAAASDTALTNAIKVCSNPGGTIIAPAGTYTFALQIVLDNLVSVTIRGDGSALSSAGTKFTYTGTASPWISSAGAAEIVFDSIQLTHNNASFVGTYWRLGASGGNPANSCALRRCVLGNVINGVGNIHLDLDKTITFSCENTLFTSGNPSVRGQATGGASYSNLIRFYGCEWTSCYSAPVANGGSSWSFIGCNFEALNTANNPPGALVSPDTVTQFVSLDVAGCWLGDAGTGTGTWFNICGQAIDIHANYFGGGSNSTAIALNNTHGVSLRANYFSGFLNGINFATSPVAQITVDNNIMSATNPWVNSATNAPLGALVLGNNFGFGLPAGHYSRTSSASCRVNTEGSIEQFGTATVTIGTPLSITFPQTFPNNIRNLTMSLTSPSAGTDTCWATSRTTSGFTANVAGVAGTATVEWHAIGD
jgi:hypothetical protein